jgi:hypothetical protein
VEDVHRHGPMEVGMTAAKGVARPYVFEIASSTMQKKVIDAWLKHHLNHHLFTRTHKELQNFVANTTQSSDDSSRAGEPREVSSLAWRRC